MTDKFSKDPNATIDFQWDWSQWLVSGDTIVTAEIINPPSGITVTSFSYTTTTATVWLSGGTVGTGYSFTCRISTAQGRTDDRTIYIICEQR